MTTLADTIGAIQRNWRERTAAHRWLILMALASIVELTLRSASVVAQQTQPEASQAEHILSRARALLAQARTVQVDINHADISTNPRGKMEIEAKLMLAAERPNRIGLRVSDFRLVMDGEEMPIEGGAGEKFRLACDGSRLHAYEDMKQFTNDPAPQHWSGAFDRWDEFSGLGPPRDLAVLNLMLLEPEFPGRQATIAEAGVIGTEEIAERSTQRLRFVLTAPRAFEPPAGAMFAPHPCVLFADVRSITVDVWIDAGDEPFVRRIETRFVSFPHPLTDRILNDTEFKSVLQFSDWRLNAPIAPAAFELRPGDMKEVISFIAGGSGWPLVGSPLTPFTLELVDGGVVSSAECKGRALVVIYWNGKPEGSGFPAMVHVASQFNPDDVAIILVNVGDSNDGQGVSRGAAVENACRHESRRIVAATPPPASHRDACR